MTRARCGRIATPTRRAGAPSPSVFALRASADKSAGLPPLRSGSGRIGARKPYLRRCLRAAYLASRIAFWSARSLTIFSSLPRPAISWRLRILRLRGASFPRRRGARPRCVRLRRAPRLRCAPARPSFPLRARRGALRASAAILTRSAMRSAAVAFSSSARFLARSSSAARALAPASMRSVKELALKAGIGAPG